MSDATDDALTRRRFLATGAAAAMVAPAAAGEAIVQPEDADGSNEHTDEITPATVAEAQKIAALAFTEKERRLIVPGLKRAASRYRDRRQRSSLPNGLGPATVFDPGSIGSVGEREQRLVYSDDDPGPLPDADRDIAFAPARSQSIWIRRGDLTSTRLTRIYLDRLRPIGAKLEAVITITEDLAMRQAHRADEELKAGRWRGSLHGLCWGAKDLLDTRGIRTTWGAAPYKDRVPDSDAAVVTRLADAGAVLVAKTTMGALAYGDMWFGGTTRNPWNLDQGSSGSSAGSAAGTAAGLFSFSLGTETLGSIVSPCMRCGATGLRPTFGRVARTGAMALCWSMDKIGVLCRSCEDCAMVLPAIAGADPGDASSVDAPFNFDATRAIDTLRVGYVPTWFEKGSASDVDRAALKACRGLGVQMVEMKDLPDLPYGALLTILNVEAAAAFEELTLTDRDDELTWQEPRAWPNSFRTTWFTPAIEFVQAMRFRRQVTRVFDAWMSDVDAIIGPSFAGPMLVVTNNTGHPSLTFRAGFDKPDQPRGVTIWGHLFDEGTIVRLGMALERALDVWDRRPPIG